MEFGASLMRKQTSTTRHVDSSSVFAHFCDLHNHTISLDPTLTHQGAEGDDGQEPLDQHPEPVRQGSVVAAVWVRLVDDVGHVDDIKRNRFQESFRQKHPVHVDKKTTQPFETKGAAENLDPGKTNRRFLFQRVEPKFLPSLVSGWCCMSRYRPNKTTDSVTRVHVCANENTKREVAGSESLTSVTCTSK